MSIQKVIKNKNNDKNKELNSTQLYFSQQYLIVLIILTLIIIYEIFLFFIFYIYIMTLIIQKKKKKNIYIYLYNYIDIYKFLYKIKCIKIKGIFINKYI